jgi:ribosomal-protein-alanine N-acetyltransferase
MTCDTQSADPADYFLSSARLGFRTWRTDDLELAMSLWGDIEVTRLIDARGELTPEQVKQKLDNELKNQAEHGVQYWPCFMLEDGDFVGCSGLRPYDLEKGIFESGVHIRKKYWRQGLGLEASQAVMAHAFGKLGIHTLFAGHNPGNHASRVLLTRQGFEFWKEEYYPPTGLMHPSYLLKAEKYRPL